MEIVIDHYFYGEVQVYQFPVISCINDEKNFIPDMHVLKNRKVSSWDVARIPLAKLKEIAGIALQLCFMISDPSVSLDKSAVTSSHLTLNSPVLILNYSALGVVISWKDDILPAF